MPDTGRRSTNDSLPPNVEVVRHDGSDSFLDHIAASRLVALPIKRENISASGIGVYLAAMALGKCVVISEGPAVNGVVPPGAALIVPPEMPRLCARRYNAPIRTMRFASGLVRRPVRTH